MYIYILYIYKGKNRLLHKDYLINFKNYARLLAFDAAVGFILLSFRGRECIFCLPLLQCSIGIFIIHTPAVIGLDYGLLIIGIYVTNSYFVCI